MPARGRLLAPTKRKTLGRTTRANQPTPNWEERGLTQQIIADLIAMHRSNYSRVEAGERDLSIEAISKIAKHFHMTIDQLVNFEGDMPQEVVIEDKTAVEQMQLIQQLDEDDKNTVFKIIDKMLTNKKFKEFFQKNVAAL